MYSFSVHLLESSLVLFQMFFWRFSNCFLKISWTSPRLIYRFICSVLYRFASRQYKINRHSYNRQPTNQIPRKYFHQNATSDFWFSGTLTKVYTKSTLALTKVYTKSTLEVDFVQTFYPQRRLCVDFYTKVYTQGLEIS